MTGSLPNDNNHTLLRPIIGSPGTRSASSFGHTLPEGTRIGEFEITGLIGEGGFGIVYLAFDHSLQRRIALKEYMPSSLAARTTGAPTVQVKYEHQLETFQVGLRSFVNEARLLAQFDHPALVKVHRFWEANGTAYMVMPFYEGPTLRAALATLGHPPDESWLRDLLDPLLDALSLLHSSNCFHRDIAPDNILLTSSGPLLLDFGAARRVIGAANQALTVILKPGFAPVEQYGELAAFSQGAWTDIYALACVVYAAISGKTPIASIERLLSDRLEPLSQLAAGRYDPNFLKAIDAGLAVKPQERPQDVAAFRTLLDASRDNPGNAAVVRTLKRNDPQPFAKSIKTQSRTMARKEVARHAQPSADPAPKRPVAWKVWLGVGAIVVAISSVVFWRLRSPQSQPVTAHSAVSSPMPDLHPTKAAVVVKQAPMQASLPSAGRTDSSEAAAQSAVAKARDASESVPAAPVSPNNGARATAPQPQTNPGAVIGTASIGRPDNVSSQTQRCSEILQKGSLEPLTPEESDFLRRECK